MQLTKCIFYYNNFLYATNEGLKTLEKSRQEHGYEFQVTTRPSSLLSKNKKEETHRK